jgi:glycosyltransferase involved in cell wall biosynthesis
VNPGSEETRHASVAMPSAIDITFLIPAYNEAKTIGDVLDAIAALGLDYEAIVVDDGSTDETADTVSSRVTSDGRVQLLRKQNGGKGSALRHGIPYCKGEIVVVQDADMEYDPSDVPTLIEPIQREAADVVYGSRLSGGRPQRAYMFWHLVGNRFLSVLTGMLFNTTLSDMETGYKAFRREALQQLQLTENHFGIEPEITGEICRRKMRVYEIPISYYGRTHDEGKNITWRDGFRAVFVLLRTRLRPLKAVQSAAQAQPLLAGTPQLSASAPASANGSVHEQRDLDLLRARR